MANSALTIGRLGLDVETDTDIRPYPDLSFDGDRVSFSGDLIAPDVATAKVYRQQLNGYGPHNTDEPIVAVTWEDDDTVSGFYFVVKSEVSTVPASYLDGKGWFPFSVDLVRVEGYQAPLVEVVRNGAVRSNSHSFTNGVPVVGLPGPLRTPRFSAVQDGEASVATERGSVRVYGDATYSLQVSYAIEPDTFYEGACRIEVSHDEGVSWHVATGRQLRNLPSWVRLSNGRVRCTLGLADGATVLTTEVWDSDAGAWEDTAFHVVDTGSTSSITTYTHKNISSPGAICAVASDSRVYWVNTGDRTGRSTMAGSIGAFRNAVSLFDPRGICEGPDDHVWFASGSRSSIWEMTLTGTFTEYTDANIDNPRGICESPDGLLWFTSFGNDKIGKITTAGTVTMYTPSDTDGPTDIVAGPDGLLWYTSNLNDRVNKITTAGTVTSYTTGVGNAPNHICAGPDGLLWYTRTADDAICKITTTGTVTTYTAGVPDAPNYICSDGTDLWFTYSGGIGKITTSGTVTTYTDSNVVNPQGICKGADGNLWFTSYGNNRIGSINPVTGTFETLEFGGTLTALRNSPEAVSIRVGAGDGDELLDITLRRGMNIFEGVVQSDTAAAFGIYRTDNEAGTNASVTGGIKANAANASNNIYTLLSPQTITLDTNGTSGIYLATPATTFKFGFSPSHEPTVTGTATIIQAYFAAVNERQNLASR